MKEGFGFGHVTRNGPSQPFRGGCGLLSDVLLRIRGTPDRARNRGGWQKGLDLSICYGGGGAEGVTAAAWSIDGGLTVAEGKVRRIRASNAIAMSWRLFCPVSCAQVPFDPILQNGVCLRRCQETAFITRKEGQKADNGPASMSQHTPLSIPRMIEECVDEGAFGRCLAVPNSWQDVGKLR